MSQKIEVDGQEVEVYTAEEVATASAAKVAEAVAAKEAEFAPKITELTGKLTEAEKAAAARAGEFTQFRKLSEEQVAALAEKDRIIYQNSLALKDEQDRRAGLEESAQKAAVAALIKTKAAGNADLEAKMTEMWGLIQVEATTPEQLEAKASMVLGALSTTVPDLVATASGFSGTFQPPNTVRKEGESFADTEAGKNFAAELGLKLTPESK